MNETTTRVWLTVFVALVFICGLSLGFAASVWFGPRPVDRGFRGAPPFDFHRRPPAFVSERILNQLETDPEFTDTQRQQLEELFTERQQQFRAFSREMRDRFARERESLRADVAAILTPAQMEIFDAARRRRMRHRAGPGSGPDRR